jgi:ABC-type sugar transport system ATPase subunit
LLLKLFGDRLATEAGSLDGHEGHPGGGTARLTCRNLGKRDVFADVSFEVHAGEIFFITGLIGSKRTDLVRAIFGADSFDDGSISLGDAPFAGKAPSDGIRRRVGFVPEDRHRDGLMLNLSVAENLAIAALDTVSSGPFLFRRRMAEAAARHISSLDIRPTDAGTSVRMLSGGNQQKVLIGKWLQTSPDVLILDEPTVGVDVGAKSEIYGILRQLKRAGSAILAVSSDIEEVMMLSDRIMVMRNGRVQGIYNRDSITRQEILDHIGGA